MSDKVEITSWAVTEKSKDSDDEDPQFEDEPSAKRQKVQSEEQTESDPLQLLPNCEMYERSYMHRDIISHILVTPVTDFLITCSVDGHLKFWKKLPVDIIFVKHFRPHLVPFTDVAVSVDGQVVCTTSADRSVKVFEVLNFDMINLIRLRFTPSAVAIIHAKKNPKPKLAVCSAQTPEISIYDTHDGEGKELHTFSINSAPVNLIKFNAPFDTVITGSTDGLLEYWSATTYAWNPSAVKFKFKTSTDLFEFAKKKTVAHTLSFNRKGTMFATYGKDQIVRVFDFATGKLKLQLREDLAFYQALQTEPREEDSKYPELEPIDFGRRVAVEKEIVAATNVGACAKCNINFDDTSEHLVYACMLGIKVVRISDGAVVQVTGSIESSERFLATALFQGTVKNTQAIYQLQQQNQAAQSDGEDRPDPTVFTTAHKRARFYMFTRRDPADADGDAAGGRDVFNEKPTREEVALIAQPTSVLGTSAIIRTTMGDIHIKLFGEECPKAVENFTTHSRNGYYNNLIVHRVIKGFMIQTGDPQGDGRGGTSIWEEDFEDEFHKTLKFDRPFTVAMANCGPGTNGSQFFITTVPTPWLDGKHTIFGRVTKGMDVVQAMEQVKTNKSNDKPWKDIKMLNIEVM